MGNLWEYNGRKVASFSCSYGEFIGKPNLVFKVEEENGEMAIVRKYYVILLDNDGTEIQRWNYHHLVNVRWEGK